MKRWSLPLCVLVALFVSACGALRGLETGGQEPWLKPGGAISVGDSESLLRYFEYVHQLPPAELAKEHDVVQQLYAKSQSDFSRVRYAMLLSLPGSAFNDDARALDMLDPLLRDPDAGLHPVAFIVSAQIQQQRRSQELHRREQQRSQELQQKLDAVKSLEQELRHEQQRSQELQQKLDALKSLDRSLIERDQGGALKRP